MNNQPHSPSQSSLTMQIAHAILAEAAQRPWLAALLARRADWLKELAQCLSNLTRHTRRFLRHALAAGMAMAALMAAFFWTSPARAGTITVDGTTCTLANAITTANTGTNTGGCTGGSSGADTIDLQTDVTLTAELPNITSEITIEGNSHTIQRDSGAAQFSVITIASDGNLTLKQATITGGTGSTGSYNYGGGIFITYGTALLQNCTLSGNNADYGAGVANQKGTLTVQSSTISGNTSKHGGAIYNYGATTNVENSTLSNNSATTQCGGAIQNSNNGTLTVDASTLSGNYAGMDGGGICNDSGTATIQSSTLSNNTAGSLGGGIDNHGTLELLSSAVTGNTAYTSGGGISNGSAGNIIVRNSTISGNSTTTFTGGGIYNWRGAITLENSTLSGNSANAFGGGVYLGGGSLTVKNSILALQSSGDDCGKSSAGGTITSQGYNIESATSCGFTGTGDQQNVTSGNLNLGALADNGGDTQTRALGSGSVAIDRIANGTNGCVSGVSMDQRGAVRADGSNRGGTACDVGAYEANSNQTPTAVKLRALTASTHSPTGVIAVLMAAITTLSTGWLSWRRKQT